MKLGRRTPVSLRPPATIRSFTRRRAYQDINPNRYPAEAMRELTPDTNAEDAAEPIPAKHVFLPLIRQPRPI